MSTMHGFEKTDDRLFRGSGSRKGAPPLGRRVSWAREPVAVRYNPLQAKFPTFLEYSYLRLSRLENNGVRFLKPISAALLDHMNPVLQI